MVLTKITETRNFELIPIRTLHKFYFKCKEVTKINAVVFAITSNKTKRFNNIERKK